MYYQNEKLNEIFRDTWPNLGWAARKNTMTHEEMLEEAAKREEAALKAVDKLYAENGDAMKQLAEIEKQEREETANEVLREEVMRIAIAAIDKYSGALKELAATEKEELKQQLEALKKENFQKVADYCMEEYTKQYGEMPEDEYWVYMVADYFGTGEGTTTCLMITQATPYGDDYPSEGPDKYKPVNSQAYRAVRKFHEQFGTWMLGGLKFLPKNEFYTQCAYFIPPAMMKLANAKCFKEFYNEVHYNFS